MPDAYLVLSYLIATVPFTVALVISKILQILGLLKSFSRSLPQFFLTVGQNSFWNKILFLLSKPWPKNQSDCFYFFPSQGWTPPKSMNMCSWKKLWVRDPPISTIIPHSCPLAPSNVWWACKRCHFRYGNTDCGLFKGGIQN